MALLGHVSAAMSLRYARLFDATVRTEYERALDLAESHIGPLPAGRPGLPLVDVTGGADWKAAPALKTRLAGGFCLRAPVQGACPYANICEHCPSFRTDSTHLPVLAAQRLDAQALARPGVGRRARADACCRCGSSGSARRCWRRGRRLARARAGRSRQRGVS